MSTENEFYLPVGKQILSIPKVSGIPGTPLTITPDPVLQYSRKAFHTTKTWRHSTYTREQEPIKGTPSSGIGTAISGLISTIAWSTLITWRPPQPPTPYQNHQQKRTILPESRKYFSGQKLQLPQQSRNSRPHLTHPADQEPHLVAQRPQRGPRSYKQVRFLEQPSPPRPCNQQVRFLLRPCLKERHPQYPDSPAAHFRPQDPLLPHFQRHRLHLQDLIHLTHRQQWPNRTNPHDLCALTQHHMTGPPTRLP